MIHILESFACGLAFAMGVTCWFFVRDMVTAKGRAELMQEFADHNKRVEDRLAVQVSTMVECLKVIKDKTP